MAAVISVVVLAAAVACADRAPEAASDRRWGMALGAAIVAIAALNAILVVARRSAASQLCASATGVALLVAVIRWAGAVRTRR